MRPRDALLLADLDHLHARVAGEHLQVVLRVVGVRRAQPPDGQDDDAHDAILDKRMAEPDETERHINIHFSPEMMGGVYANFANVSFSDYEFTITFARVDHEIDAEEIPGVVVSRVNLAPKFMRELADALEDSYSKYATREGIKNLPEFGGGATPPAARRRLTAAAGAQRAPRSYATPIPIRSIVGGWVASRNVCQSGGSGSERLRSAIRFSKPMNGSGSPVSVSA